MDNFFQFKKKCNEAGILVLLPFWVFINRIGLSPFSVIGLLHNILNNQVMADKLINFSYFGPYFYLTPVHLMHISLFINVIELSKYLVLDCNYIHTFLRKLKYIVVLYLILKYLFFFSFQIDVASHVEINNGWLKAYKANFLPCYQKIINQMKNIKIKW